MAGEACLHRDGCFRHWGWGSSAYLDAFQRIVHAWSGLCLGTLDLVSGLEECGMLYEEMIIEIEGAFLNDRYVITKPNPDFRQSRGCKVKAFIHLG